MKVRKEVVEIINELRSVNKDSSRWDELVSILEERYRMDSYSILALFYTPPIVEYDGTNKNLLFEIEEVGA